MPFRSRGRSVWKTRLYLAGDGSSFVASCGTTDQGTAKQIEAMCLVLKRRLQTKALELVRQNRTTLAQVFIAYEANRLDQFVEQFSEQDLDALVAEWDANPKYKSQVRRFIPEGERFGAERFTTRNISLFLKSLPVSGSTKIRYRAALSVLANWLVEIEAIPHNPVSQVKAGKPNKARMVWLERHQAQALIGALTGAQRACEALMAATGIEWQVIERLRGRDVDLNQRTVHAQGGKTEWRNRVVRPTEEWAWRIFADYAKDFTANALIFQGLKHSAALRTHKRVSHYLGLPATTLHDWRHTYAVLSLKDGYRPHVVAHQLGHRDAYLVITRYGRHVPSAEDYVRRDHAAVPSLQALG